ncbi:MAG: NAD(P)-dependent oxidoreductase, partial [Phycisphaeraceae bacterium]|nr:NAD(P)-dependent oxidoreductase [Phycisphaeraceae bacterium]
MSRDVIIITGAAGFLGSALAVGLSKDHQIIAVDRRHPTDDLRQATPSAWWHQIDISNHDAVATLFHEVIAALGRIDFVIHFAAYYDFNTRWHEEYERTNVVGTANVLRYSRETRVKRLIFASSIAALSPPASNGTLTEKTAPSDYIPYAKSKSIGEEMLLEKTSHLPVIILRIGGAFSDWCELPPLSSALRMWTGGFPMDRIVAGRGASGIPYIHRLDVVHLVKLCLDKHDQLDPAEIFLASQNGAVSHKDLWTTVSQAWKQKPLRPWFMPKHIAAIGVRLNYLQGCFTGRMPFERPWMTRYIDHPWVADTTYTRTRLDWDCTASMQILERIPTLLRVIRHRHHRWITRNNIRNRADYT